MHWTEPATSDDSHAALEKTLWDAANQFWSNAALKPSEYSPTVLGLIFLRYADVRFAAVKEEIQPQAGARRKIGPTDFHAAGVVYLPDEARFSHLLSLSEGANVGQAVNEAMRAIEKENGAERHRRPDRAARRVRAGSRINPDLADVLPKSYHFLESRTLASLLKTMASISIDIPASTPRRLGESLGVVSVGGQRLPWLKRGCFFFGGRWDSSRLRCPSMVCTPPRMSLQNSLPSIRTSPFRMLKTSPGMSAGTFCTQRPDPAITGCTFCIRRHPKRQKSSLSG